MKADLLATELPHELPLGFSVLTPIPSGRADSFLVCLPFHEFEKSIYDSIRVTRLLQQPTAFPLVLPDCSPNETFILEADENIAQDVEQRQDTMSTFHSDDISSSVFTALESVMPPVDATDLWADNPFCNSSLDLYTSPLHRRILFSISNNFVGIGAYSFQKVIELLKKETSPELYRLISSSPSYSAKALVRNLFKGAIEVGDALLVRTLLTHSAASIDPNQEIFHISPRKYTLIERAASLQHKEVIEVLLNSDADVNKTYGDSNPITESGYRPLGALDNAIVAGLPFFTGAGNERTPYKSVDLSIVEMLLDKGADVQCKILAKVIEERDGELVIRLMRKFAKKNHEEWIKLGVFIQAIWYLNIDICMEVIQIMLDVGADLNHEAVGFSTEVYPSLFGLRPYGLDPVPQKFVDTVAKHGNLAMIKLLFENLAIPSGETLTYAISNGEIDVVKFLLSKGCSINGIGPLKITPLAAAIRLGSPNMRDFIIKRGALNYLHCQPQLASALRAASQVGDLEFVKYLAELGVPIAPREVGYALIEAISNSHEETAHILIDLGADLYVSHDYSPRNNSPALLEAIKSRNEKLVTTIINAGTELAMSDDLIESAVEWGNYGVVKRLIIEGANPSSWDNRYPLNIAIGKQDEKLVEILLNAEADPNSPGRLEEDTPLAIAATQGDVKMVKLLFDYGADPDEGALRRAASEEVSDLILQQHRKRYRYGNTGFGSILLIDAILEGDKDRIAVILKEGMDPTALVWEKDGARTSPFGCALRTDQPNRNSIVKMFLANGCDPDSIVSHIYNSNYREYARSRVTALLVAVGTNDKSLVETLIRSNSDVNFPAKGNVKRTPLQRAAECGFHEMVEFLIRLGADVNAAPAYKGGGTALQLAAAGGHLKAVSVLLCHGADVDAPASKVDGRTALEASAEHGRLDTVQMLLNARAKQNRGGDRPQFESAKEFARENGHFEVVELLEDYQRQHELGGLVEGEVDDAMGASL